MGLKILHSADWHMDSPFLSFREEQREKLKAAQLEIPGRIALACREQSCDAVLLAGDLFDGPWTRESLDAVRDALAECRAPVFIAPGNHDPWGENAPWQELWPENVHIFGPKLESIPVPELELRVWGAGFSAMDSPALLEGFQARGEERYQIGLFHGDPVTVGSHYNPVTAAQICSSGLSYLALGHIHKAGGLEAGDTVCGWPGCPMGRGWDEPGEKGYLLVTLEQKAQLQPVCLGCPGFYKLTAEVGEDPAAALEALLPAGGTRDFLRITLTGWGKPDLAALTREFSNCPNLELRDETGDPEQLWDQAGEDSLRGAFFRQLQDAAAEGTPEQSRKAILAAQIARTLLEGREVPLP